MRISKVRITDNRPPIVGKHSSVDGGRRTTGGSVGMTGLDHLTASQAREAAAHDKCIRDYAPQTVEAAWNDLQSRECWNRKDAEHRWVMARRAALRRLGVSMRERGLA